MNYNKNIFNNINKNNSSVFVNDENQAKNSILDNKNNDKKNIIKQPHKKLQEKYLSESKIIDQQSQQKESIKWEALQRFFSRASRSHTIYKLKIQTLFLAYSLAEQTVSLLMEENITFEYWTLCCLYLAMKFQQIYPPRLKQLSIIFKNVIRAEQYNKNEYLILQKIDLDINDRNISTIMSQFIHEMNSEEKFYFYYLLELSLIKRKKISKFTLKQIIFAISYTMCSRNMKIHPRTLIQGMKSQRIEQCAKILIVIHTYAYQKASIIYRKYDNIKMNYIASKSLPILSNITKLICSKCGKKQKRSKNVSLCKKKDKDEKYQKMDEQIPQSNLNQIIKSLQINKKKK